MAEAPSAGALVLPDSLEELAGILEGLPQPSVVGGKARGAVSVLHVVLDPSGYLPTGTHHCLQVCCVLVHVQVLCCRCMEERWLLVCWVCFAAE